MSLKAGFAEIDITPPIGTHKIGWLIDIVSDRVLDPLFARVAVFECGGEQLAFIQLDTLCIRWTQVNDIRRRVHRQYGFPPHRVMVAATHNHAGPAVAGTGDVKRDDGYIEILVQKIVSAFGQALAGQVEAQAGFGQRFDFTLSHNRRVVMRDGTVKTHWDFHNDSQSLYVEGPIDPAISVLAVRGRDQHLLGCLVNFTAHPTHHGGGTALSGGYPGVLAKIMQARGCPVTLFLNGASGNISCGDPYRGRNLTMEAVGMALADHATLALAGLKWRDQLALGSAATTLEVPFRKLTADEIRGTVRGAQRFVDPGAYDRTIPAVCETIRKRKVNQAEVQALFMDELAWVGIPAEYFVQHGLRIKASAGSKRALIVGHANGMLGYVPHREAFERGGYETTFAGSSRLAPEAGDLLADAAIALIKQPDLQKL